MEMKHEILDEMNLYTFENLTVIPARNLSETDREAVEYIGLLVTGLLHRNGHDQMREIDQRHVRAVVSHITALVMPHHLEHLHALSRHNCIHGGGEIHADQ